MSRPQTSHLFYQSRQRRPVLDQARGVYMWDVDGKRYLDGSSGAMVCNIGHSNPRVLEAMRKQMDKSTFGYRLHFETESAELLAARTAALAPEGLEKVFFVSGGSEAVESAIKLARQNAIAIGQAQRYKIISREPSYHGCTLGALALTGYAPLTAPFDPMMRPMPKIPAPRAYLDGAGPGRRGNWQTLRRHAGGKDPVRRPGNDPGLHCRADRWRLHRRARAAERVHAAHSRDLHALRRPADS